MCISQNASPQARQTVGTQSILADRSQRGWNDPYQTPYIIWELLIKQMNLQPFFNPATQPLLQGAYVRASRLQSPPCQPALADFPGPGALGPFSRWPGHPSMTCQLNVILCSLRSFHKKKKEKKPTVDPSLFLCIWKTGPELISSYFTKIWYFKIYIYVIKSFESVMMKALETLTQN